MPQPSSLRSMRPDQTGTIASVCATGELGRRIRDMGLVPGTQVTIVGRAPLQDPVALTLRNNEADLIMVSIDIPGGSRQ
jgi:ferrous iron transport protein A